MMEYEHIWSHSIWNTDLQDKLDKASISYLPSRNSVSSGK